MRFLFFTLLTLFIANVFANTEKLILEARSHLVNEACVPKFIAATLTPPYTKLQQSILPSSQSINNPPQLFYLGNLDDGSNYEIRVSYPAITPGDFTLNILNACQGTNGKLSYVLSVSAVYTGVSQVSGMEAMSITYDLVLETLYFGFMFYQCYKIVLAIIFMLFLGQFLVIPRVKKLIIVKTKNI